MHERSTGTNSACWNPHNLALPLHSLNCTVLLAEDDLEMRKALAEWMRSLGWRVLEASDGGVAARILADAVARSDPTQPDVLVMDIQMPHKTGLQVLEELRCPAMVRRSILITAFGDSSTHARARQLGALVLDKPFRLAELRGAISTVLELTSGPGSPNGSS